ncbi:hypothetical protein [Sinomonas sp. P47F7]|uniref:aggregation-promoting factor C-terminal-like domain-containing protein n=1 Tax=Sinomonas sp. P47F7 TaxID=3410987 RepID=UPI003BF50D48
MRRARGFRLHRAAAAVASVLLALGAAVPGAVADNDTPPSGFPSWDDVQAAKANVDSAQAEVTKINGLLTNVQAAAADASSKAVAAGVVYAKAEQAVQNQQKVVDAQRAATTALEKQRDLARQAAGRVASAAYIGGAPAGALDALSVLGQSDGLDRLGTIQILGDQASKAVAQYKGAANNAAAAEAQSRAAEEVLAQLSAAAKQDLDAAQAAQKHAQDVVAQTQQQQSTLTAQLASLKGTSADVEQRYEQGQAALAAYEAAQEAKRQAAEKLAQEQAAAAAAQRAQVAPAATVVSPRVGVVDDPAGAQAFAGSQIGGYGWGGGEYQCLLQLWTRESSWMTDATNPSSGAYGIAQALPPDKYYSAGSDWLTNYRTQIVWGLGYIRDRYGSPCAAWSHEVAIGWY